MKRKRPGSTPVVPEHMTFQVFRDPDGSYSVETGWPCHSIEEVELEFIAQVRAPNFLEAHLAVVGELPELDEPIKPLVLLLNRLGFPTLACCSGHAEEGEDGTGYVLVFLEHVEQLRRFKNLIAAVDDVDAEEGPCDCEGACHGCGHPPLRFMMDGRPLPDGNFHMTLELSSRMGGEWSTTLRFGAWRPLTALDYQWLVERIEVHCGLSTPPTLLARATVPMMDRPNRSLTMSRALRR